MTVLEEGNLQITLPASVVARKFDDATHGLSHCMKAVDFIFESTDRLFFVEFKDPETPEASSENRATFLQKFLSGKIDQDLKTKCRDTWLYEWALGRAEKPVTYLVLIAANALSAAELLARTDALKSQVPLAGPNHMPWKRAFVAGCMVMNIDAWNKALPQFPVSRI
jgi:hypothetical protein